MTPGMSCSDDNCSNITLSDSPVEITKTDFISQYGKDIRDTIYIIHWSAIID